MPKVVEDTPKQIQQVTVKPEDKSPKTALAVSNLDVLNKKRSLDGLARPPVDFKKVDDLEL